MQPVSCFADVVEREAEYLPATFPNSTYELIKRGVTLNSNSPALSFFMKAGRCEDVDVWTYGELFDRITQTANAFHALGVGKDDVISYVLPNLPETHFTIWGGEATGIVAAFNPLLEPAALGSLLASVNTKVLVTLAPFPGVDLWSRLLPELGNIPTLEHVVLIGLADRVPADEKKGALELQQAEIERVSGPNGLCDSVSAHVKVHSFYEIVDVQPKDKLVSGRQISSQDPSSYFCTGGTTGLPKIAMRTHGNEVANAISVHQFMGDVIGPGKTLFCGLPLFHVNGVLVTGLLPFSSGAHVLIGSPQGYRGEGVIANFWKIVQHHRINFFSAVPTLYAGLLHYPVDGHDISSLEYGICGAAPLPVEVANNFQATTKLKILEGYGLTEGTCVSTLNPVSGQQKIGAIGLRLPGQLMKAVVLDETGEYVRDCTVNEVGVLVISGANVFLGYHAAVHNQDLWIDCRDDRRWMNTGDLGRQDEDGLFWLTGRKKELIIRGGHNIDPIVIEEAMHQHPNVQLAAAVGRPDTYAGELPVVYVQLKPTCFVTENDLAEFVRTKINERAAIPKYVRIIPEMPLTSVGKLFKPALKRREIREAIVDALTASGIVQASVSVTETTGLGTNIIVELAAMEMEGVVQKILGGFSYPFSIQRKI